jgi:steroid delta-isomerase-like uncharacterized protein
MSVEDNVALMRRWFEEVWNEGRVETVHDLTNDRTIGMGLAEQGTHTKGSAGFLQFLERIRGAFPDIETKVEDAYGAGDRVTVRWSAHMTHSGDHLGVPASHNPVRITGITIVQIREWQDYSRLEQLGSACDDGADRGSSEWPGCLKGDFLRQHGPVGQHRLATKSQRVVAGS